MNSDNGLSYYGIAVAEIVVILGMFLARGCQRHMEEQQTERARIRANADPSIQWREE